MIRAQSFAVNPPFCWICCWATIRPRTWETMSGSRLEKSTVLSKVRMGGTSFFQGSPSSVSEDKIGALIKRCKQCCRKKNSPGGLWQEELESWMFCYILVRWEDGRAQEGLLWWIEHKYGSSREKSHEFHQEDSWAAPTWAGVKEERDEQCSYSKGKKWVESEHQIEIKLIQSLFILIMELLLFSSYGGVFR